jgi:hypothetical protein
MQHITSPCRTNWHSGRRYALERRALCLKGRRHVRPIALLSLTSNARCSRPRISFQAGNPRGPLCASQNGLPSPCAAIVFMPACRRRARKLGDLHVHFQYDPLAARLSIGRWATLGGPSPASAGACGWVLSHRASHAPGPALARRPLPPGPGTGSPKARHAPRLLQPVRVQGQLESLASKLVACQRGRLGVGASVQRAAAAQGGSYLGASIENGRPAFTRMFASAPELRPISLTAASRRRFSKTLRAVR